MAASCVLALCLHLINVSSAPAAAIAAAEGELTAIYQTIGVPIRWTESEGAMLLIVRDEESGALRHSAQPIMGVAIHAAQGAPAAYVFYRRAQEQASVHAVPVAIVLAATMAHEVGHLMLPDGRHSDRGLMRGCWAYEEFLEAAHGNLQFSPDQAATIRAQLPR